MKQSQFQDPENIKTYQSEVRQLEKEHGNVVHFINPVPGYVLKTSVDGQKKGFINICANPLIKRATGKKGASKEDKYVPYRIPYHIIFI